ncbi:lamin tail domain-containing protein [Flavobacterium amniphilum]|uniref:T9SS type A sorting domain-containing protein n=1 Tax=Flavobacterium amniphilum TaxID=1834035 RepID=UPI002029D627|nr:T9SS type A sorting domain-containing protein [Flavobacterium amniphilum]MCL9806062.1 lamin tail domain-containing protein [Flavobacterium amniphilum]
MKKIYFIGALLATALTSNAQVVISQVYGGGGNAGAPYTNDFIELFNRGTAAVSLNGWSVQYTSTAGPAAAPNNFWFMTPLPNVTLQPGQYFLIQQGGGATGSALPTPDANGANPGTLGSNGAATGAIAMASANGKVILVNSTTQETTSNPSGANIIDKVGYGSANAFEGAGATGALSNTTAAIRNTGGCIDTDSNSADFTVATPTPRNTATTLSPCTLSNPDNSISGLKVYPNPAKNNLYISSDSFAEKQIELYDVLGKVALKAKVTNAPINLSGLTSGVYVVKVTEEGKTATRKIVIE